MHAKLRTVRRALSGWGLQPYPPTLMTIRALAATLKRGGYRSAASYLWLYKAESQRRGHSWDDAMDRALKDSIRSCERGLGPPTVAQPLPFALLGTLDGNPAPWTDEGPVGPRHAIVIGAWWMMREIELSTVRAAHISFTGDWGRTSLGARLVLPASKNGPAAFGAARAHRCHCLDAVTPLCPAHALAAQVLLLARLFPGHFVDGKPSLDLPLFPNLRGEAVDKCSMTATIREAARRLGVVDGPDGSDNITGHSLRCTGAQGLIRLGWRQDAVQLQGRWQSEAVKRYTRDAALYAPSELAQVVMSLCGIVRSEVPAPPTPDPEPAAPTPQEWVMNLRTSMYHLASGAEGRARCGWLFAETGVRGSEPPPWFSSPASSAPRPCGAA